MYHARLAEVAVDHGAQSDLPARLVNACVQGQCVVLLLNRGGLPTMSRSSWYGRNVIPLSRHRSSRLVDALRDTAASLTMTCSSAAAASLAAGATLAIITID